MNRTRRREPISPATERALVERARDGDLDAFEEIVRARIDAVFRLTMAILGNEADARDATQEAFVQAWARMGTIRDPGRFDAWLQRVTVNASRMVHRSRRRRAVREIPERHLSRTATYAASADRDDSHVLDVALQRLDIDQRTILVLHHLEGHSVAELADLLGIPVGTVKSRLHTARGALQKAIDAETDDS
jgi:RNA polymerase sigma-70 factor (ECF subfamily)